MSYWADGRLLLLGIASTSLIQKLSHLGAGEKKEKKTGEGGKQREVGGREGWREGDRKRRWRENLAGLWEQIVTLAGSFDVFDAKFSPRRSGGGNGSKKIRKRSQSCLKHGLYVHCR